MARRQESRGCLPDRRAECRDHHTRTRRQLVEECKATDVLRNALPSDGSARKHRRASDTASPAGCSSGQWPRRWRPRCTAKTSGAESGALSRGRRLPTAATPLFVGCNEPASQPPLRSPHTRDVRSAPPSASRACGPIPSMQPERVREPSGKTGGACPPDPPSEASPCWSSGSVQRRSLRQSARLDADQPNSSCARPGGVGSTGPA